MLNSKQNNIIMKDKLMLGALLFGAAGIFASCSDDLDSNPTLVQPTEFVLNTPAYANETVNLENTEALQLTWSQPKFTDMGAPINATYEIQVSPTGSFTVSAAQAEADESKTLVADYAAIDKTSTLCVAELDAGELCEALIKVAKWADGAVPAEQKAYIRVNAFVAEGQNRLNPVASNVIELTVKPYYIELKDAAPIMFYMVGDNFGDGAWSNKPGISSFPMFLKSGYAYDKKTGAGEITYLNYFTTQSYKIQPADFNWDYGIMGTGVANEAVFREGGGDQGNIWCDPAGYYLVTVHTGNNTCTIEKQDISPAVYGQVCISGDMLSWADVNMTPANKEGENHVWYYTLEVPAGTTAKIKFKLPGGWETNWGYGASDGEINICGKATNGGQNIGVAEGKWLVSLNDITGEFSIIPAL